MTPAWRTARRSRPHSRCSSPGRCRPRSGRRWPGSGSATLRRDRSARWPLQRWCRQGWRGRCRHRRRRRRAASPTVQRQRTRSLHWPRGPTLTSIHSLLATAYSRRRPTASARERSSPSARRRARFLVTLRAREREKLTQRRVFLQRWPMACDGFRTTCDQMLHGAGEAGSPSAREGTIKQADGLPIYRHSRRTTGAPPLARTWMEN